MDAAEESADAAAVTARLDVDRRHSELAPRFRIACEPAGEPGGMRMTIALVGPPELERLDELTVTIRDDHPFVLVAVPALLDWANRILGPGEARVLDGAVGGVERSQVADQDPFTFTAPIAS